MAKQFKLKTYLDNLSIEKKSAQCGTLSFMKEDENQNFVAVLSDFNGVGSAYIFTQNLEDVGLHHVSI